MMSAALPLLALACGASGLQTRLRAHVPGRPAAMTPTYQVGRRVAAAALSSFAAASLAPAAHAVVDEYTKLGTNLRGSGKTKYRFPDFTALDSGLQYKDFKEGTGEVPQPGDRVVIDWDGITIGYQGRYFQTRNKPKGGAFEGIDGVNYANFAIGDGSVIPAIDEAVRGMRAGGIRRIIVPEEIGYPKDGFKRVGPKPNTFSGERALDFVLSSSDSAMVDKTLMFDLKLVKINRKQ
mmetsp:Transcript_28864/g.84614  ORF Transcript_28864/g.84614 Transcript_28864/m.84614 type:complete len:236 (+) Transcript_28864:1-708(+)